MRRNSKIVRRLSLWVALNLLLVVTLCLAVIPPSLGLGWEIFLTARARERLQLIAESIVSDVAPALAAGIKPELQRYDGLYGARFAIFDGDGNELSSTELTPPHSVQAELRKTRFLLMVDAPGASSMVPRAPDAATAPIELPAWPQASREQLKRWIYTDTDGGWNPVWIGLRTLIPAADQNLIPATVLVRADNPWLALRIISFREWVEWCAFMLGLSALLWTPLLWRGARDLREIIEATERIADEQFTARARVKRSDELGRLAEEVNTVAERLENFVRNQRQFLSNIAHEVSSPLARLKVGLENLEHEARGAGQRAFADVNEEVEMLTTLISEILAFTRAGLIEPGARLQLVSLRALVFATLEQESARGVIVTMPNDLQIRTNPASLRRALGNLVRNAVRYAGTTNGPIELIATEGPSAVSIRVLDRGPGVPEMSLLRLGDPFYRPEPARKRTSGGLGLGLATVKNCVAASRGSLTFRNRDGGGFEATILLPGAGLATANVIQRRAAQREADPREPTEPNSKVAVSEHQ